MAEQLRWPVVLFDLDGTIIEPFAGIAAAVRAAFESVGEAVPSDSVIRSWIGPPIGDTLEAALGERGSSTVDTALAAFRHSYDTTGARSATLHQGMRELIGQLQTDGAYVAVVTMKPSHVTQVILEQHQLSALLSGVFAPLADKEVPSKAHLVGQALASARGRDQARRGGVVIGDRVDDIDAAFAHGIDAVGVTWGFGASADLVAAGASEVAATPAELARICGLAKV